jgi:hypothetical protein
VKLKIDVNNDDIAMRGRNSIATTSTTTLRKRAICIDQGGVQ